MKKKSASQLLVPFLEAIAQKSFSSLFWWISTQRYTRISRQLIERGTFFSSHCLQTRLSAVSSLILDNILGRFHLFPVIFSCKKKSHFDQSDSPSGIKKIQFSPIRTWILHPIHGFSPVASQLRGQGLFCPLPFIRCLPALIFQVLGRGWGHQRKDKNRCEGLLSRSVYLEGRCSNAGASGAHLWVFAALAFPSAL